MPPAIENIQSVTLILAAILGTGAIVAFFGSRYFGHTRNEQRWIFRGVTILTVFIAGAVIQFLFSN